MQWCRFAIEAWVWFQVSLCGMGNGTGFSPSALGFAITVIQPLLYILLSSINFWGHAHCLECLVTNYQFISHSVDGPRRTTCHLICTSNVHFLSGTNFGHPLLSKTVRVVICNCGYGISWWGWDSTVSLLPSIVIPKQLEPNSVS
jgi:hypothetical protein